MKNKKKGKIEWDKFVGLIIMLIAVAIVILVLVYFGGYEKIKTLFPDFFNTNYTIITPAQCPEGYTEVGYIAKNRYVSINGKLTKLYIENGKVMVHTPWVYGKPWNWGSDLEVGQIVEGVLAINFPSDLDRRDADYKNLFPSEEERRLLSNAKIYEGTICMINSRLEYFRQKDSCVLTCQLVDGVCSDSPVSGKVSYKQLNCPKNQICYVDETEEKLSSKDFNIADNGKLQSFYFGLIDKDKIPTQKISKIVSVNTLNALKFERIGLSLELSSAIPYCYAFDSDKTNKNLGIGYKETSGAVSNEIILSNQFSYSGDKFVHFVVWNNIEKQKIIKRWRFNDLGVPKDEGYDSGKVIKDEDFYYESVNAGVGDILYVIGLDRTWEYGATGKYKETSDYKIVKYSASKVCIYARDRTNEGKEMLVDWHLLFCNKGASCRYNYWIGTCIDLKDASRSLSETFDKMCCWRF